MTELWRIAISAILTIVGTVAIATLRWQWRQNERIDVMYQHLFGIAGKNGTAGRIAALEKIVGEASGDPLASPAGRQMMRRLDAHELLAQAQGEALNEIRTETISRAMSKVASQMTTELHELERRAMERIHDLDDRLRLVERRKPR